MLFNLLDQEYPFLWAKTDQDCLEIQLLNKPLNKTD